MRTLSAARFPRPAPKPSCAVQFPRFPGQPWWLWKQTWRFKPEEMHDLEFEPAIPIFAERLADQEGYFAALNLTYLGSNAVPALMAALQSTNPAIRVRVASVANRLGDERLYRALFDHRNDPEPELRLTAAGAALHCPDQAQIEPLLRLLRDQDNDVRKGAKDFRAVYGNLSVKDVPPENLPRLTLPERRLRGDGSY